jgi:hypothetical protein
MRNITIFTLLITLTLAACSTTKKAGSSGPVIRDGTSAEKAIVVNSVPEEYDWLKEKFPGSKMKSQSLLFIKKVPYDRLTFVTADGDTKDAYFDISSFFGKY